MSSSSRRVLYLSFIKPSFILITLLLPAVQPAKILMTFGINSYSFRNNFLSAARVLGGRGHQVTLVTSYPLEATPMTNVQEIELREYADIYQKTKDSCFEKFTPSAMSLFKSLYYDQPVLCKHYLSDPAMKPILESKEQTFDVAIVSALFSECSLPLAYRVAKHVILLSPSDLFPFLRHNLNIPTPYSYLPSSFTPYGYEMNFLQRTVNTFYNLMHIAMMKYFSIPEMEKVTYAFFPSSPPIEELQRNVSLILLNRAVAVDFPHPSLPFIKEIGGIHCRAPRPLPQDLEDFVSDSEHGFFYMSLSSYLNDTKTPEKMRDTLVKVFSMVSQNVVWKHKAHIPNLPDNIFRVDWAPQQDLLGHPNIRGIITHGGHLSVHEAIFHGVPMIGLPMFGDQATSIDKAVKQGIAIRLDWKDLTEDVLFNAMDRIANDARYTRAAKQHSYLLKDRPYSPQQSLLFWVEYVIRHNGAHHLRPKLDHLNVFQYLLLDVVGLLLLIVIIFTSVFVWFIKRWVRRFRARFSKCKGLPKSQKKNN